MSFFSITKRGVVPKAPAPAPLAMALEQRFMFDAAGAATALDAATDRAAAEAADRAMVAAAETVMSSATPGSAESSSGRALAIIDASLDDHEALASSARDAGLDVAILAADADGIEGLAGILAGYDDLAAVHLFSHGRDGAVALGDGWLDQAALDGNAGALSTIASAFAAGGDLLLYGCDVAETEQGIAFLESLSSALGVDIAASDDLTGSLDLGGDWDLETVVGASSVEADRSLMTGATYAGLLAGAVTATDATVNEDHRGQQITIDSTSTGTTHLKITNISNGTLYTAGDLRTEITEGSFIAADDENSGLAGVQTLVYFSPDPGFDGAAGFDVQGSTSASDAGLFGATDTSTITVNDAPDLLVGLSDITFAQSDVDDTFQKLAPNIVVGATAGTFNYFQVDNIATEQRWLESLYLDTDGTGIEVGDDYALFVDSVRVGTIGGGIDGGTLAIVLNQNNATQAIVQRIVENVIFRDSTNNPEATRTFEYYLRDSNGFQDTQYQTITVTDENVAPINRNDVDITTLGIVESQERSVANDQWLPDRGITADFRNTTFDGRDAVYIDIDNVASSNFYGYKRLVDDTTRFSGDLYMDSNWLSDPNIVRPGVWLTGFNEDASYDHGAGQWPSWPLVEYNKDLNVFRVWDDGVGYVTIGTMPGDAAFDTWYTIAIELTDTGQFAVTIDGTTTTGASFQLSETTPTATNVEAFRYVSLNSRADTTSDYDVYWSNLTVDIGDSATSSILATGAVAELGTVAVGGLSVTDRDGDQLTTFLSTEAGTVSVATGGTATVTGNGSGRVTIVGTDAEINAALAGTTFTAAADAVGTATITMRTSDPGGLSDTDTISVNVSFVNDRPTLTDPAPTLTVLENETLSFREADFQFSDADTSQSLASITIQGLPDRGSLSLNGAAVTAGQVILAKDINNLVYQPPADAFGSRFASFTWTVSDGIASSVVGRLTINVTEVPDALPPAPPSAPPSAPPPVSPPVPPPTDETVEPEPQVPPPQPQVEAPITDAPPVEVGAPVQPPNLVELSTDGLFETDTPVQTGLNAVTGGFGQTNGEVGSPITGLLGAVSNVENSTTPVQEAVRGLGTQFTAQGSFITSPPNVLADNDIGGVFLPTDDGPDGGLDADQQTQEAPEQQDDESEQSDTLLEEEEQLGAALFSTQLVALTMPDDAMMDLAAALMAHQPPPTDT